MPTVQTGSTFRGHRRTRCGVVLWCTCWCFALLLPAGAQKVRAPLPDKILHAKTVFLIYEAGDGKAADALYAAVKSWGKYELVQDKAKADLVLALTDKSEYVYSISTATATAIGTQAQGTAFHMPVRARSFYLRVFDANSAEVLWTESRLMYWTPSKTAKLLVQRLKDRAKVTSR